MNEAGFNPGHPLAIRPINRLRAFHSVVRNNSDTAFPTLVMNDGAAAYRNVEHVRVGSIWRFVERSWNLYSTARAADEEFDGAGLRGVIAVGLRALGSASGIRAQEQELSRIIDELVTGKIDKASAQDKAHRVRRNFDIVPQLQANFAFARAYEAEKSGRRGGFEGPGLFLDTTVFRNGVPNWITTGTTVNWIPANPNIVRLSGTFVALKEMTPPSKKVAIGAFRTGEELLSVL
jgi:hypothetical protein